MPALVPPIRRNRRGYDRDDGKGQAGCLVLLGLSQHSNPKTAWYHLALFDSTVFVNGGKPRVISASKNSSTALLFYAEIDRAIFYETDAGIHYAVFERDKEPEEEEIVDLYAGILLNGEVAGKRRYERWEDAHKAAQKTLQEKPEETRSLVVHKFRCFAYPMGRRGDDFLRVGVNTDEAETLLWEQGSDFVRSIFPQPEIGGYVDLKPSDLQPQHRSFSIGPID